MVSIQGLCCYSVHAMLNVQKKYIIMQSRDYIFINIQKIVSLDNA